MKIVISSQIELLPSLFVRRCFDAFERNNNNGYSSLINHAQLTSIETCHFFSPSLVSASQLIIRCVSHRNEGPLSHRKRPSTEVIVAQVEIQYIECSASARFCPLFLSHVASSPLHTFSLSTHSRPVHGRASGRATLCTYSIHPRIGIVHESRPALLKNRFLSRERAAPQRKLQVNSL